MHMFIISVAVAAVFLSVSSGHLQKRSHRRRRPFCNLATISCSKMQRDDLCKCCEVDLCAAEPCQNGGTCVPEAGKVSCKCADGYTGDKCEIDLCAAEPCQNGGTCVPEAGGVSCSCANGFTGDNCEVDLCAAEPCQNGGTCVPEAGKVSCKCADGYTGDNCENDECEPNPCQNCGTCSRIEGGFKCSCLNRISGPTCEVIDNIITSPYYPNNYPNTGTGLATIPKCPGKQILIVFDEDFVIQKIGQSQCDPHSSLGEGDDLCQDAAILEDRSTSESFRYCGGTAPSPFTATGDVVVAISQNGDNIVCMGFRLTYSYVDDECEPNPCQNCGTCSRIEGGFKCSCLNRISGPTCEVIDNIITSPNYPNNHRNIGDDLATIPGCPGKQILIVFDEDFVMQKGSSQCEPDSSLGEGADLCRDAALLEDRSTLTDTYYCGGTAPPPYTGTEGASVVVTIIQNQDNIVCMGFSVTYSYVDA